MIIVSEIMEYTMIILQYNVQFEKFNSFLFPINLFNPSFKATISVIINATRQGEACENLNDNEDNILIVFTIYIQLE